MSTNLNYKQVANVKRRTWDVEAYEKKAKERAAAQDGSNTGTSAAAGPGGRRNRASGGSAAEEENAPKRLKLDDNDENDKEEFKPAEPGAAGPQGSQRAFLQPRSGRVDIDSKIGETEIISAEAAARTSLSEEGGGGEGPPKDNGVTKSGVGWHCRVCDCFLKDSMTYLDHINGRKHQRKLGYSMRVERSTKDQMMGRLSQLAKEKEKAEQNSATKKFVQGSTNYQDVIQAKDQDEAQRKAERARRRKEKKKAKKDAAAAAAAKAKAQAEEEEEENPAGQNNGEGRGEKQEAEEVEEEGINPDLAAMMGFSGFGGGK